MPAGLQVRAPGNRRGSVQLRTTRKRVAQAKMSCQTLSPAPETGANAEETTAQTGITCGVQAPTLQAANGVAGGPMVSFPLSPRLEYPGECRAALQAVNLVVAGSNPAAPPLARSSVVEHAVSPPNLSPRPWMKEER